MSIGRSSEWTTSLNLPVIEKKSMNVYDIRIKAPYSITLSGVSGSIKFRFFT